MNQNEILEVLLQKKYQAKDGVLIDCAASSEYQETLGFFHMKEVYLLCKDKDSTNYFCGIRADHFSIEFGYMEDDNSAAVLITANHKGHRVITLMKI